VRYRIELWRADRADSAAWILPKMLDLARHALERLATNPERSGGAIMCWEVSSIGEYHRMRVNRVVDR
jgi:hypothetical protein